MLSNEKDYKRSLPLKNSSKYQVYFFLFCLKKIRKHYVSTLSDANDIEKHFFHRKHSHRQHIYEYT